MCRPGVRDRRLLSGRRDAEFEEAAGGVLRKQEEAAGAERHAFVGEGDATAGLAGRDAPQQAQRRVLQPVDGAFMAG